MSKRIIGNTTATPMPVSDWNQTNAAKADYIKNKPTLGELSSKDMVSKTDLDTDIQTSLAKADTAIQSFEDFTEEQLEYIRGAPGLPGKRGAIWYTGLAISGEQEVAVFPLSGISNAIVGDMYLNKETGIVYQCVTEGNPSQAEWSYVMFMGTGTGGSLGGGGSFDYTASLENLLDSRIFTISEGTKVELKFNYTSVDSEGFGDGPGVGKIVVDSATKHTFTAVQGENSIDVTAFLSPGSNNVKVQVENSEGTRKLLTYEITVAVAYITSAFDASVPYSGAIPFVYTPTGIAEKTVHFELDGTEIGTSIVTVSGRQQSYTIPAQSHGAHSLRVWFECEVEGVTVFSNVARFTIICIEEGKTDPIIAVDTELHSNVKQFANVVTKYRVYDPKGLTTAISLEANGEVVSNLTVNRTEQTWTYRPTTVGELVQTIRCGEEYVSWTQTVTESEIKVEAETDALALYLSSYGRSNTEANPGVWESGNISAEFENFNFTSDGWKQDEDDNTVLRITGDARLNIPYKIFSYDFRTTGKTIEFEMATREVLNYDTEVVSCFSGDRGFTITAQQLRLASEQCQMGTRYKEDEHLRVTFVIEKRSENRLILCYINGIMSGAAQYPTDDDFSQSNPVGITIGSNECTTDLYNIRIYDNSLTRYQVLDNWIADTQSFEERADRYLRNNIYDDYGNLVISRLPTDLCYMILEGTELPQFKGDKKTCSGAFVDRINSSRSFTFSNAEIDVQGTSSQYYYVKNYKIKFKNGFILPDGSTADAYQMNVAAVPVNTFTMKADVASSEGAFNVVLAMLYNDLCSYKTPTQEVDARIRQTIEGFPMVMFWNNGSETKFLGKYNFNNDKGTEEVFGFQSGDESWEIRQNGTDRVGWHSADFSDDGWKNDFEARYPDKNTDTTRLQALAEWLVSTDTAQAIGNAITPITYDGVEYTADTEEYRLAKFSAELSDHFIEDAIIFYYLFTEIFLCIDQREKNAFPTYIASLDRWIVLFYDADSSLGTDNKGNLAFDYWLEDIDYTEAGDPIYNGQNSVLWKNLRATRYNEIRQMYQNMRIDRLIDYDSVISRFEEHQSKWTEAIFNEDMYRKCLEPLIDSGDGSYIPMLQGKKEMWMKWWLYNRFRYLDSKYETGTSMENRLMMRTHEKANVFLTAYANIVGHVYFNSEMVEHRMERGVEYEFEWTASGAEDTVIGINDADLLTDLGDLSPHMVEEIDVSGAPHITTLKIGDGTPGYENRVMNSITLGNNILLRTLDLRNCVNLTQAVDVSGCTNIENIYCDGTSITGLSLPNGGILKVLHLPDTVTNLTVLNQNAITEFVMDDYSNITTLRIENSPAIPTLDILDVIPNGSRVRLLGFSMTAESSAEIFSLIDKLDAMRGLDENGNNTDLAQVSGTIYINELTTPELNRIREAQTRYPSLAVAYVSIKTYTVRFFNYDGTLLQTVTNVAYGSEAIYNGETPIKPNSSTAEQWEFIGWSPSNANVIEDLDCIAQFKNTVSMSRVLMTRAITGDYENDKVESVGSGAFNSCKSLETVTFPYVISIANYAFGGCDKLISAVFPIVNSIGESAFKACKVLPSFNGDLVTTIGPMAFADCSVLSDVSFDSVQTIGHRAFSSTAITEITLPSAVQIDEYTFQTCYLLTKVDLPVVTKLGSNLFWRNTDKWTQPPVLILRNPDNVCTLTGGFGGTINGIYVPRSLVDSYKSATNWSTYADQIYAIEDYPEICGGEA